MEFFGNRSATNNVTSFENMDTKTLGREVARAHQPVVAATDDDGIEHQLTVGDADTGSRAKSSTLMALKPVIACTTIGSVRRLTLPLNVAEMFSRWYCRPINVAG